MLELINRCLRTLDFRHVVRHVGERTEAGIFVHRKGRAAGLMHVELFHIRKETNRINWSAPVVVCHMIRHVGFLGGRVKKGVADLTEQGSLV